MFYRRQRLYTDHNRPASENFTDVLPKKLTFRKKLHPKVFLHNITDGWCHTIFNEVDIIPFDEAYPKYIYDFMQTPIEQERVSKEEFGNIMFEQMKKIIRETWNPKKFNILPHSSGFDSRLLMLAMNRLGYSPFIFESHGEHEHFKKVMEYFDKNYYIITYDSSKPKSAHEYCFDFKNAWKSANGYTGYPLNQWYWPIEWLQKNQYIPSSDDSIQSYTGYGANETNTAMFYKPKCRNSNNGKYKWAHPVGQYFSWHYLHQLSGFAMKGEWIHPFYNLEWLQKFVRYSKGHIEHIKPGLSMSRVILEVVAPELAELHKMVTSEVKKAGYFTTSKKIMNQAVLDYENSWYGKKHPFQPTNSITYTNWWGHWQTASLCEHLLENSHEIS